MKKFIVALFILFTACTKEYSSDVNIVNITITGTPYSSTVNGSSGNYWLLNTVMSQELPEAVKIIYMFDDGNQKDITVEQVTQRENNFYTQIPVSDKITNIRLVRVVGDSKHIFRLL